jgi:hypothetical protein
LFPRVGDLSVDTGGSPQNTNGAPAVALKVLDEHARIADFVLRIEHDEENVLVLRILCQVCGDAVAHLAWWRSVSDVLAFDDDVGVR